MQSMHSRFVAPSTKLFHQKTHHRSCIQRTASSSSSSSTIQASAIQTVGDIMTTGKIITCTKDTSIDAALELLVDNRITGLPVVDSPDTNIVIGVVSDFDLLALEGIGESDRSSLFPTAATDWETFFEIQKLISKNAGKSVGDVMTSTAITVTQDTSMLQAANVLLKRKFRRLPVVDQQGKLVGILTRANIIKAALASRKNRSRSAAADN
jgi:CBS domain-containing protein